MRKNGTQYLSVAPVSTTTVYSDPFLLANVIKLGLDLTASGTGVDILVELQIRHDDDDDFIIEDGYSNIVNLTSTTRSMKTVHDDSIPAAKWGRLSFTGQNANPADAAVTGYINPVREETQ